MKLQGWLVMSVFLLVAGQCTAAEQPAAPFKVAHEAPLKAREEVVADTADHKQLRVEFNGIHGDRVPGFLYLPKGAGAPRAAVLLQYGIGGSKKTDYIVEIGQQFIDVGFVVLTIDAPDRGERRQPDRPKPLMGHFDRERFAQYCGDYSRAVDYLDSRPEVDRERIGYVGISWGAITGLTYVANDPRIKAMSSIVGGANFGDVLSEQTSEETKQVLPSLDPVDYVGKIAPRPLVMINVTRDILVARPFAEALHKAAGEGSKALWLETDHYFNGVDRQKIIQTEVVQFMQDSLPPSKKI